MRVLVPAAVLAATLLACGVPGSATPDAGAGNPDQDAGPGDGGEQSDGGAPDASVSDAGNTDPDAGTDGGSNDGGSNDAGQSDGGILTGVLVGGTGPTPGPIGGVHFVAGAVSGDTDAAGTFRYPAGQTITFSVSDISFRPVAGAPLLSPWQLVGTGTCAMGSELERLLVLLYSLDADGDPATGTQLTPLAPVTPQRPLSGLTLADVQTRVGELISGRAALAPAVAVDRFIRQVDDETWAQVGLDTFTGTDAAHRGQGVATDGTHWYFSSTVGVAFLEKTDLAFNTQTLNSGAIPLSLYLSDGSNHIGDIDVYNGTLYAPIEDGSAYQHPKVGLFDAATLSLGPVYSISNTLQTQGVPWVAIDAARGFAYLAEWSPTTQLNRFSLTNLAYVSSLAVTPPAGMTLTRIQGAKVFEGALYCSTDDAQKNVFKLNLETGTVLRLFSIATSGEEEGIAFLARPDGSQMHTQYIPPSSTSVELRHHARTRLPLRKQLCP